MSIITVTMNPSIDVSYPLEKLAIDSVNRINKVLKTAGGKGLNVTRVLRQFDVPVKATGVLGGYFGEFIKDKLKKENIEHAFSEIGDETRSCIAILHEGEQTEILESGPEVTEEEQDKFLQNYENLLEEATFVTISGSLAKGIDKTFYTELIKRAKQSGVKVLLDTSGETLGTSLSNEKPFLIKPNEDEISQLVGKEIISEQVLIQLLEKPLFQGIEWIVISLGSKGAFIKHNEEYYRIKIPKIKTKNPVGSGDSTIAGLAFALYENMNPIEVMKTGMTAGMLNAQEEKTGDINIENFDYLYNQIEIEKLK